MIDTIVGSIPKLPAGQKHFIKGVKENVGDDYSIKETRIPFVNAIKYKHAYRRIIKFEHKDNSGKYFVLKIDPRPDFYGLPEAKIKTEVSLFRNNDEFQHELSQVCKSEFWHFLLRNHRLTELHTKCDIQNYKFEDIRTSLDYPYSRKPHIAVNKENGRKTLYLTTKNYFYEKSEEALRSEMRHYGADLIEKKLGVSQLGDIGNIREQMYFNLYQRFKFYEPYQVQDKGNWDDYETYRTFLYYLDDPSKEPVRTKRRDYIKQFNSFINAKNTMDKRTSRRFSRRIIPRFSPRNICLRNDLIQECERFKGAKYER